MPPVFKMGGRSVSLVADQKQRVLASMERLGWAYINSRNEAVFPLWQRLLEAVQRNRPITVRQWVNGIPVLVERPQAGMDHVFDPTSDLAIDREIAVELATFMSARSYFEAQVFVGAFIIDQRLNRPADGFFDWLVRLGLFSQHGGLDKHAYALAAMTRARNAYMATGA